MIDLFSDASANYAASRPSYPPALFDALAALAPGRALAWDAGTGSGQAAAGLGRRFAHVHATDLSAAQIAAAPVVANITFAVEPAERVSLADASADLVLAAQAFHWFDHAAFLAEAARVLRPAGVLAVVGYSWFHVDDAVDAAVHAAILAPVAHRWHPANRHLWRGYHRIHLPGREVDLPPLAIHRRWSLDLLLAYVATWSAVRAHIADHPQFMIDARASLATAWGDPARARGIVMPLTVRAVML